MVPFGYELEFCGANLIELSCAMQIPLKPKGRYKNYDTFHLEPEEKIKQQSTLKEEDIICYLNDFPNNKEFSGKRKCIRFATSLASYIGETKWTSKEIDEWYRNTYIEPRRYSDKRNEILTNTLHL